MGPQAPRREPRRGRPLRVALFAHDNRHAARAAVRSYRERMARYATMRSIEVFYDDVQVSSILTFVSKRARPMIQSTVHSAAHHDALHELPKLTAVVDGHRRIVDVPPVIVHRPEVTNPLITFALDDYRASLQEDRRALLDKYQVVDYAMKVVGVGSVGLGALVCLLDGGSDDDPLFIQAKQAVASVYERFLGPSDAPSHGARVVAGQRRLQAASDIFLGTAVGELGRHWYIRQLQDMKGSAVVEAMTIDDLVAWGELCGWALARGHARSGEPATIADTSATMTPSTSPSGHSPRPTPTRPSAISRRSRRPSRPAGSRPGPAFEPGPAHEASEEQHDGQP